MEILSFGPSHNKTEVLLDHNEAESIPGAFKPIIQTTYFQKHDPQMTKNALISFL